MIKYENECCDCAVPGYPCIGDLCGLRHVAHYYCDGCDKEFSPEELFNIDGEMLCEDCAKENISYRDLLEEKYGTVEV